jgi:hypothetical protein
LLDVGVLVKDMSPDDADAAEASSCGSSTAGTAAEEEEESPVAAFPST